MLLMGLLAGNQDLLPNARLIAFYFFFFLPINHLSAHSNIQTCVIKSVRTTISDLCLGYLMD